jgi:hypothetical protein
MDHSRQTLLWTVIGSVAGVIGVIVALVALTRPSGGSAVTTTAPTSSAIVATSPAMPASSSPSASATISQPSVVYLSNMTPAGDLGFSVTAGPAVIYGHTYPNSVGFMCGSSSSDTPGTYNLNGRATEFRTTVGVPDNWPTNYVVGGSVIGDGHTLATFSVSVLKPEMIKVNVSHVEILQLQCSYALDTSDNETYAVGIDFGDARLIEHG